MVVVVVVRDQRKGRRVFGRDLALNGGLPTLESGPLFGVRYVVPLASG